MTIFLLAFMIILVVLCSYKKNTDIREAVIRSYVIVFFLIAGSTEIASLLDAITYHIISVFWVVVAVFSLLFALLFLKSSNFSFSIRKSLKAVAECKGSERFYLSLVGIIILITLLVALLSPPGNWDSMTYHMSRVAEWIQHKNVYYYPTSIERQNYQMPLAEFAILHLQLLSTSDKFANLVQWYSFCVSILLVSLIAKEFQMSLRVQLFSTVLAATIPMAILQSSSTQNDLVVGAFCLSFAYFLLKFVRTLSFQNAIFCALSLGLALLTKGTAYIYCCAIGLTIGVAHLLKSRTWKMRSILLIKLTIIVVVGLLLNVGHLYRNYTLYGHPILINEGDYINEDFSPTIVFSNIVRNSALHSGTPSRHLRRYTYRAIQILLGDQLYNPKSTMGEGFQIHFSLHEDYAGNPLHFMLAGLVLLALPLVRIDRKTTVYCYASSIVFSMVFFCLILRWQPWGSRLHTPIFMLSAPLIAVALAGLPSIHERLCVFLAILLFVYSSPFLLLNYTRPLIPYKTQTVLNLLNHTRPLISYKTHSVLNTDRMRQYFVNRPHLYEDYTSAVKVVLDEGKERVGLYLDRDDWEYPLWVLADRHASKGIPQFGHVGVTSISNKISGQDVLAPDLVLATKAPDLNMIADKEYDVIFESKYIKVLKLKDAPGAKFDRIEEILED